MDGASLAALPPPYVDGPTPEAELISTLGVRCPSVYQAKARIALGFTVYRGVYSGNFSNVAPLPWMGGYHSSELPMIMGTYADIGGPGTAFQNETSVAMQDLWLAFANDPENGLANMGWSKYNGSTIIDLGGVNNATGQPEAYYELNAAELEDACIGYYPYTFIPNTS
jgi:hypothetical protein